MNMIVFIHFINSMDDHIHLAVSIPPKIAIADFVKFVKGSSAHFVNRELNFLVPFVWQRGYGVLSFGQKNLNTILAYIQNQKSHHTSGTTISYLEQDNAND